MHWSLELCLGILVGWAVWRWAAWPFVPGLLRWWYQRRFERHVVKTALPKGTRPGVSLEYDGVTYDLTEDLLRAQDEGEKAVWIVLGPQHLRMSRSPVVAVAVPVPRNTEVRLALKSEATSTRFATEMEIRREIAIVD